MRIPPAFPALTLALGVALGVAVAASAAPLPAQAGAVLDRVKAAGALRCGVIDQPDDWGKADVHASLPEFGEDFCHAVAAAVLGSADRAKVVPVRSELDGFRDLQAGDIDMLMGASPSPAAGVAFGTAFAQPVFFDGDALLVHRSSGIKTFGDLAGRLVCFAPGTPGQDVLFAEAARRHVAFTPWPFEENGEMLGAVVGRKCDALFGSASRLAEDRTSFHGRIDDFELLPERYSVLPLSPAFQGGDPAWAEVVGAVAAAPARAEAGGIDRAHAGALRDSADPLLRPLGGTLPGIDPKVIDDAWAIRAIGAIGNAAEIFDRDLGAGSDLKLPRGASALWTHGGLMVPATAP